MSKPTAKHGTGSLTITPACQPRARGGTTAFVRLIGGDTERFVERLREEYDTSVVPGRFFGSPAHFRIGMGVDHAMFTEGLRRISELLARF